MVLHMAALSSLPFSVGNAVRSYVAAALRAFSRMVDICNQGAAFNLEVQEDAPGILQETGHRRERNGSQSSSARR